MWSAFSPLHASGPKISVQTASVLCQGNRIGTGIFNFPIHLMREKCTENAQCSYEKIDFSTRWLSLTLSPKKCSSSFRLHICFHSIGLGLSIHDNVTSFLKETLVSRAGGWHLVLDALGRLCSPFLSVSLLRTCQHVGGLCSGHGGHLVPMRLQ